MKQINLFCACIIVFSGFLAAFSQILLKKSSNEKHSSFMFNYLNVKVVSAYIIFAITLFMNIYAYTGVPYKYGSVLNASSYIFAMLLSVLILKDRLSWQCIAGNCLIICGIIIYASNCF